MKSTPDTPTQLAGSALTQQSGGPGGHSSLPLWHASSYPPGAFSLGPLQRPVLFSREKRMGGWEAPLLEGIKSAPSGRTEKFGPLCGKTGCGFAATHVPRRGTLVPARGGNPRPAPCAECTALGSAFSRSAPFGRKEKCGRAPCAETISGPGPQPTSPAFARMKRRSFSPSPPSEEGKATGLYKNGGGAVFLFHMKHFLAFHSPWV